MTLGYTSDQYYAQYGPGLEAIRRKLAAGIELTPPEFCFLEQAEEAAKHIGLSGKRLGQARFSAWLGPLALVGAAALLIYALTD